MLEKLGITELNEMQREACDAILRGKQDVVVLSPTGTGKTLAYLVPLEPAQKLQLLQLDDPAQRLEQLHAMLEILQGDT